MDGNITSFPNKQGIQFHFWNANYQANHQPKRYVDGQVIWCSRETHLSQDSVAWSAISKPPKTCVTNRLSHWEDLPSQPNLKFEFGFGLKQLIFKGFDFESSETIILKI